MDIPEIVKTILRSTAPTLLTGLALPPPFNVIASSVVSEVLQKYLPADEATAKSLGAAPSLLRPDQVTEIVKENAADPQFVLALKQAEADLRKYELDAGIRFAEIETKERAGARDFQQATGITLSVFKAGMWIVWIAIGGMGLTILGSLWLTFGVKVETNSGSIAAFGLIGTAVGFINGIAASIVSFYWGSSQGSKDSNEAIRSTFQNLGTELARQSTRPALPAPPPPAPAFVMSAEAGAAPPMAFASVTRSEPAIPAPPGILADVIKALAQPHTYFPDGVSWALTSDGIAVDGAAAQGTPGEPKTVARIWSRYGDLCAASAKRYGVPVELIVATIAAESGGDPNARRAEPRINDESVGRMQTLVGTARQALGNRTLDGDDLLRPEISIEAGTAYIAQQRGLSHFDPPLVAAAYNAGSLRRDASPGNRWKLLCYPSGTGRHIENWAAFFGDCMRLSTKDGWDAADNVPGFASCLK